MSSSDDDWEAELADIEDKEQAAVVVTPVAPKAIKPQKKTVEEEIPHIDITKLTDKQKKAFSKIKIGEQLLFQFEGSLRAPICCILGHVDTGKTKILDIIRSTSVQNAEAGGITQQIGATFFPKFKLEEHCKAVNGKAEVDLPGLLIIDTPGHESFNNLRSRGTTLCDIAVLVIDIMHGLEPQTRESIQLLKNRKAPFCIALNKVDRLYDWKSKKWSPFKKSFDDQAACVHEEFRNRWEAIQIQLWEESINSELWWNNKDMKKTVSVIPTSAHTGEGIPDLLFLITGLTQKMMAKALAYRDEFQCTLLEVKHIEGYGCTIDVVLVNGTLDEGDQLVICGLHEPIVTTVKCLLTPRPMKEIRVKGEYIHHRSIKAAMGVKISGNDLENSVAGTSVFKVEPDSDIEKLKLDVQKDMTDIFASVKSKGKGVYVQASTLGSLEALLQFLKDSDIPVHAVNLGAVSKMDIKKASSMNQQGAPELAVILAFDVEVSKAVHEEAKKSEVTIFQADIIYHLFDSFTKHREEQIRLKKEEMMKVAVFPCIIEIIPGQVYNSKNPIILGMTVKEGTLKTGTPLYVHSKQLKIGRVESIEHNKTRIDEATQGMDVAVKISGETNVLVGRHFVEQDQICSLLSRESIRCLKKYYKDDLKESDWAIVDRLKKQFGIIG